MIAPWFDVLSLLAILTYVSAVLIQHNEIILCVAFVLSKKQLQLLLGTVSEKLISLSVYSTSHYTMSACVTGSV